MNRKFGFAGGMATVLLANIHSTDILKTAILAAIGALVSFIMTWVLNRFTQKQDKQKQ